MFFCSYECKGILQFPNLLKKKNKNLSMHLFILIFSEKWPSIGLLDSHLAKSLQSTIHPPSNQRETERNFKPVALGIKSNVLVCYLFNLCGIYLIIIVLKQLFTSVLVKVVDNC